MSTTSLLKKESGLPKIYVYVWFDIEDYVTKESDDLPLKALSILEKHGVPATCKLVAEKVRRFIERDRTDVISAIAKQDIGYHLDTHSQHPTVYEYMRELDLFEGASEFLRREEEGLKLVEKVFRRKVSCFGHPGPAFSSHFYPAIRQMGIPVYLDETAILNVHNEPYWYCGVLNLNGANKNFVLFDYTFETPSGIIQLKEKFRAIHNRLQGEGGAVSVLFHLHTAINKKFWDEVNFADGRNTSRDGYVRPPAQPAEATKRAWENFDDFIGFVKSFDDVSFITASEAAKIYERQRVIFDQRLLGQVLQRLGHRVRHLKVGNKFVSASELFYAVVEDLARYSLTGRLPTTIEPKEPFGPNANEHSKGQSKVKVKDVFEAACKTLAYMNSTGRIPNAVEISDSERLSPADFMVTGSNLLKRILKGSPLPEEIRVLRGHFVESKYANLSAFKKACSWKVLPKGFKAPKIFEQIILQTWTLKPAVPKSNNG